MDFKEIITQAINTVDCFQIIGKAIELENQILDPNINRCKEAQLYSVKILLESKALDILKVFITYHNKREACFYLERLMQIQNIEDANNVINKIYFLDSKQERALKELFYLRYAIEVNEQNKKYLRKTLEAYLNQILLSLTNYLYSLNQSKWEKQISIKKPQPVEKLVRNIKLIRNNILTEAKKKYIEDSHLTKVLESVENGEEEIVSKLLSINLPENFIDIILDISTYDSNTRMVRIILESISEINSKKKNELLTRAVKLKNYDLAKYMLERGAKDVINPYDADPLLHYAIAYNREDLVRLLLKYKADPNAKNKFEGSPLIICASWGYVDIARLLLNHGSYIDEQNKKGETALLIAVKCENIENIEIIKLLIEKGADLNIVDNENVTALIEASCKGKLEIVKLLVEGSDVNARDIRDRSALWYATERGDIEIVELLLKYNASVDMPDYEGYTPLIIAAHKGYSSIVKLLLERNANPNHQALNRACALFPAICNLHTSMVKTLLEYNANPNLTDGDGGTSLHWAAIGGNAESAKILLEYGADPNIQCNEGRTALHIAIEFNKIEIIRLLINSGADVTIKSKLWDTPISLAKSYSPKYLDILLKRACKKPIHLSLLK